MLFLSAAQPRLRGVLPVCRRAGASRKLRNRRRCAATFPGDHVRRSLSPEAQLVLAPRPSGQLPGVEQAAHRAAGDRSPRCCSPSGSSSPSSARRSRRENVGDDPAASCTCTCPTPGSASSSTALMFVAALRHAGLAPSAGRCRRRRPPRRSAPAFTALALYTGALWGRPTWGTFWEWDGRMTSTLILLLHLSRHHRAVAGLRGSAARPARIVAIVTLVGGIDIPIIKFSVDWWNTLHQPASIVTATGPRMAGCDLPAAAPDGAGLHAAVPDAAFVADAHRDPPPPRRLAEPAGRRPGSAHDRPRPAHRLHRLGLCRRGAVSRSALIACGRLASSREVEGAARGARSAGHPPPLGRAGNVEAPSVSARAAAAGGAGGAGRGVRAEPRPRSRARSARC